MMTPKRPYFFRAMYDWILENQLTPHIVVDTTLPDVQVPPAFIEDDKITLNLTPQAVTGFAMNNEGLEFKASFGGRLMHLYVPFAAIIAVYALENNHCLVFNPGEINKAMIVNMAEEPEPENERPKGPPKLHIVK
jgi:stringent starvation protein B